MSFLGSIVVMNLRTKFVIPIAAMLIGALLTVSSYFIDKQSDGYFRELETSGETMIWMLAINAESGVLFGSSPQLNELLGIVARFKTLEYAAIFNSEGTVLAQIGLRDIDTTKIVRKRKPNGSNDELKSNYFMSKNGRELLLLTAPILSKQQIMDREHLGLAGGTHGTASLGQISTVIGHIELALTVEDVNQEIAKARSLAVLLTLLVVFASFFVLAFIVNAITKPITQLVTITDKIGRGDLDQTLTIDRRDEIGHLASTFNTMIESLRQSRAEVERHQRTLEDKIRERTQQLDEAQSQLIQSEKMSAIGQLAAGVAHELNNPLGGILGYAQFTLEKLRKNIPEKTTSKEISGYRKYVTDIEIQARRCKAIVQNLLRFSRSSKTIEVEQVNINLVLKETISFIEHQLQLARLELQTELTGDLPSIEGNSGQLQQVFTNLIINAMHAMEPGGVLTVISRYSPALGEFSGAIEITFADTGSGILRENLGKIFEPFFTTKEVGKGTGLGLSVSYGIIREHGGEISVSSAPGAGTKFTIVLPVQKQGRLTDTIDRTDLAERQKTDDKI